MRIALLVFALVGCSGHRGLRIPGPTTNVGSHRSAYVPPDKGESGHAEPASRGTRQGRKVAKAAESFIGNRRMVVHGEKQRYDCSGMVCAAHKKAGIPMRGSSKTLYQKAKDYGVDHKRKRPDVGDIAFFDNTWDRNKNGRRDDRLTHVAIVEQVERDGTITLIHLGGSGITQIKMNMRHPNKKRDSEGKRWNSVLRSQKDGGPVLTAQLCVGFGSLWAISEDDVASR
ncbi:MAG: CHAP domain-containing protein [Myxococcota bacterium]